MDIFFLEHWGKVISFLVAGSAFIVSPLLWWRWMKAQSELRVMEVTVKKNRTFREELDLMNTKIDELTEEVRMLRQELHQERMEAITLRAQKDDLEKINAVLRRKIDEAGI